MTNAQEYALGKTLKTVIIALRKNDGPIPAASLESAKLFESFQWEKLPDSERASRLAAIRAECGPGTPVAAFFDAYPHPFTRARYADFLTALSNLPS